MCLNWVTADLAALKLLLLQTKILLEKKNKTKGRQEESKKKKQRERRKAAQLFTSRVTLDSVGPKPPRR